MSCRQTRQTQDISQIIEEGLNFAVEQYQLMAQSLPDSTRFPRSTNTDDGTLMTSGPDYWCSGFFPGSLWHLYEYSGDQNVLVEAMRRTAPLEKEKLNTGTHDLGFMLYNSFGNGYRLTENPDI